MTAPYKIQVGAGIELGSGVTLGSTGGGGGGTGGVNGTIGSSAITDVTQIPDTTATLNGTTGFTINNAMVSGVAIHYGNMTGSNQTFFSTYGTGITKTVTWGPGSTAASNSVFVINSPGATLVFFIQGMTGPTTFNFPFTFN
jgi:hypothetical protein